MPDYSDWSDHDLMLDALLERKHRVLRLRHSVYIGPTATAYAVSMLELQIERELEHYPLPDFARDIKK